MDIATLVEIYGLPGLIIGGLAWGYVQERADRKRQTDERINDQKEHTSQIIENTRTLDRAIELVRSKGNV